MLYVHIFMVKICYVLKYLCFACFIWISYIWKKNGFMTAKKKVNIWFGNLCKQVICVGNKVSVSFFKKWCYSYNLTEKYLSYLRKDK